MQKSNIQNISKDISQGYFFPSNNSLYLAEQPNNAFTHSGKHDRHPTISRG